MKPVTLQTMITARALLEQAQRFCVSGDRYLATGGLIILQDAFELILYAVLVELGADEEKKLENLDFDGMVTEIIKRDIKVPKSGTLRAMNKLRVTAKHYGQIMEPLTVQEHLSTVIHVSDSILKSVVDKTLNEIFLTEIIGNTPSRKYLDAAATLFAEGSFYECLVETRKAYYIEFMEAYNIYAHRDLEVSPGWRGGITQFSSGGWKAPHYTRNPSWIGINVKTPFDYIQIDHENWRIDAMEWGISTRTLNAIEMLTPVVIRLIIGDEWYFRNNEVYMITDPTKENAASALDLTIEVIRRKLEHQKHNILPLPKSAQILSKKYIGCPIYTKAEKSSDIAHWVNDNTVCDVYETFDGFTKGERYYFVLYNANFGDFGNGYVLAIEGEELIKPVRY